MLLLDTNIVIEFWKRNPAIRANLQGFSPEDLFISIVTEAELLVGARDTQDLRLIQRDVKLLRILPLEPAIGALAIELLTAHTLSQRLKLADALIAATALHHRLPLFTLNRKDFRYIAGLPLHEPT